MQPSEYLDELAGREDEILLLLDGGGPGIDERHAYIGGGPAFFIWELHSAEGVDRKPINREWAERLVGGWNVEGFSEIPYAQEYEPPSWLDEHTSTTYRGPMLYPVPEDWVLNVVEADGVLWYRYEDAENGHEAEKRNDVVPEELLFEGPDDDAWLDHLWDEQTGEVTYRLEINGDEVFTVTEPDDDLFWTAVAEALARYARDEELPEDVLVLLSDEPKDQNEDLASFAGGQGGDPA